MNDDNYVIEFGTGDDLHKQDRSKILLGGKGANLVELANVGLPVPSGYIVTSRGYREFVRSVGIEDSLVAIADIDPEDDRALARAEEQAKEQIRSAEILDTIEDSAVAAYGELGERPLVAVRSSATAEDLDHASFAGQYSTYLNVQGRESMLNRIKDCWASLFNERAIYYRAQNDISHSNIDMAVVIQKMIISEKSGVMFTCHPSTGKREMIIEAAYGLGEAVVSGEVTPDRHVVNRESGEITSQTINIQEYEYVRDADTGETVSRGIPDDRQATPVLTITELRKLTEMGERIESHYGSPQDIEWGLADGNLYLLQSRPISTIPDITDNRGEEFESRGKELSSRPAGEKLGQGTGIGSGQVTGRIVFSPIDAIKARRRDDNEGLILVRKMTSPSDIQGMKVSDAVLTSQGGTTSHAAIVARELDKPTIVGCQELSIDYESATCEIGGQKFDKGDRITIAACTGELFDHSS